MRVLVVNPESDYLPDECTGYRRAPYVIHRLNRDFERRAKQLSGRIKGAVWPWVRGWVGRDVKKVVNEFKDTLSKRLMETYPGLGPVVENISEKITNESKPEDVDHLVAQWESYWLGSDMGLVWRTLRELRAIGDFGKEFRRWDRAQGLPSGRSEILIDCSCEGLPDLLVDSQGKESAK